MNIDKSSKRENLDVEVLVHSDIDKENKFIKVYSTKDEDVQNEKIPCNTAMMLVVTQFGQHMKMVECTQQDDRDFMESQAIELVYKKSLFKPNLLDTVDKITLAQDNENLKDAILSPIINQSVKDIQKYLKKNGSF